jgi:magnesium chelatase family protein
LAELDPSSGELEGTEVVAARVAHARERAAHRYRNEPWTINSQVPGPMLRRRYPVSDNARELLANDSLEISARGADRILRVAWTIADLRGHDLPNEADVAAALRYRDGNGSWQAS